MPKQPQDPGTRVCGLCGHTDSVTRAKLGPGVWEYRCSAHPDWQLVVDASAKPIPEWSGVMGELGLYDDLPNCVDPGEPFVEYGVVEYRYRSRFPDSWAKVRERYPYRDVDEYREYTASAFVAAALGRLEREGVLVKRSGRATGYWSYNGEVSYWARATDTEPIGDLTWNDFAAAAGVADEPPPA